MSLTPNGAFPAPPGPATPTLANSSTNGLNRPQRARRGPPPTHTPLKTTGHNSKPSVSLAPAAFAAALAEHNATKPKRKVLVSLPNEGRGNDSQEEDSTLVQEKAEQDARNEGKDEETASRKGRQAAAAKLVRRAWSRRDPHGASRFIHSIYSLLNDDDLCSAPEYPERWLYSDGLPDTIEIYLPGQESWTEFEDTLQEEKQREAQLAHIRESSQNEAERNAFRDLSESAADANDDASRMSSPADPSAVSSKLERLLRNQNASTPEKPSAAASEAAAPQASGLVSSDTPPREANLKSFRFGGMTPSTDATRNVATARRAPETPTRNEKTMSLSMPSSGGPFASSALIALGLPSPAGAVADEDSFDQRGTHSDGEMPSETPALKERPPILARSDSAPGRHTVRSNADTPKQAEHASKPSWKDLGAGFGYQLEDVVEESPSATHSRDPSHQLRSLDHTNEQEIEIEDDLRTNPSEDADTSEVGDGNDESAGWAPTIEFEHSIDPGSEIADEQADTQSEYLDYSDSVTESDEAEYSNPSDEEAARREREERRALRSERKAARAIARHRARGNGLVVDDDRHSLVKGRPRANTADTFASSSLHPDGEYRPNSRGAYDPGTLQPERQSLQQRGEVHSNPPDEDADTSVAEASLTFGNRHNGPIDGPSSPQQERGDSTDFQFPSISSDAQHRTTSSRKASGLNPAAKEFVFGAVPATPSAYQDSLDHFRLPSIPNSSFGGSAFGTEVDRADAQQQASPQARPQSRQVSAGGTVLNATAPAFNPRSAFTFSAPNGAPRLPQPFGEEEIALREEQGREKRTRTQNSTAIDSPPRPGPSSSSIEGGLRELAGDTGGSRPPPFDARGLPPYFAPPSGPGDSSASHQGRTGRPTGSASLRPSAPSFMPTWARTGTHQASRSSRPGIPTFAHSQDSQVEDASTEAIGAPTTDFTFSVESKAVPIRAPEAAPEQDSVLSASSQTPSRDFDGPVTPAGHSTDDIENHSQQENHSSLGTMGHSAGKARLPMTPRRQPLSVLANEASSKPIEIPGNPATRHSSARNASGGTSGTRYGTSPRRLSKLAREHRGSMEQRSSRSASRDRGEEVVDSDAESETFQDIIDELATRMDQSLDAWGGRILDEVTLAGQVRPIMGHAGGSNSNGKVLAKVSDEDRQFLLESFLEGVSNVLATQLSDLQGALVSKQGATSMPAHAAQGEPDSGYVTDLLDRKLSDFRRDLLAALSAALPHVSGDAKTHDLIADALFGRVQPLLDTARNALAQQLRRDLLDAAPPGLIDTMNRALADSGKDQLSVTSGFIEAVETKIQKWEEKLSHLSEHVEVALINGIIPHLDSFVTKQEPQLHIEGADPDLVAARVTEVLAPIISDNRENRIQRQLSEDRDREERRENNAHAQMQALENATSAVVSAADTLAQQSSLQPEELCDAILDKILPSISSIKAEPIDTQDLISKVSEVVGRQSIEHLVDLDPVTALLEPLVAKQEDVKSLSQKIVSRQRELESIVSDLPMLIGTKVEALWSAHRGDWSHSAGERGSEDTTETKSLLLELMQRVGEMQSYADNALQEARREAMEQKTEATEMRAELMAANSYSSALKDEVSRMEKSTNDLLEQTQLLRDREAAATMRAHDAQAQAAEATYKLKDVEACRDDGNSRCELLQSHNDQLVNELRESREERARERETAAQATAEVMARLVSAETAVAEARRQAAEREQAELTSRDQLTSSMREALDRAARSEGETATLHKRISDQDNKLSNLQSLTATQKQKTAESQQKLAEVSKRRDELETQSQDYAVALARLKDMEERLTDQEALQERLRSAEDAKLQLREEISQYHDRFLDLEKDLIAMKERLVSRDELEACQEELASSREETAKLQGQLAERDRADVRRQADAAKQSNNGYNTAMRGASHAGNTWDDPSEHSHSSLQSFSQSHAGMGGGRHGMSSTWESRGEDETGPSSPTTDAGSAILRRPSGSKVAAPAIVVSKAHSAASTHSSAYNREIQQTDDGWWT